MYLDIYIYRTIHLYSTLYTYHIIQELLSTTRLPDRERNIEYYAERMADVFSAATEPRLLAEMMTEIPALDILEIKYVTWKTSRGKSGSFFWLGMFRWLLPKFQPLSFFDVQPLWKFQILWESWSNG